MCINPIHRIGLKHKRSLSSGVYKLMFYLVIVNEIFRHCHFWLARHYIAFNVYRRDLAPGTVSLTGDRAQGDNSKHWAYSS